MILVSILILVTALYYIVPLIYGRWKRYQLLQESCNKRLCVITFDDGPGNRLTPQILNLLQKQGVKASFFLLGCNIEGREEIVRQIHEDGHEIGSHGFNHCHAWKVWPWQTIRDIQNGWRAINQVLGVENGTYPYRPPYGKLNLIALLFLWLKQVRIVYWTLESKDAWAWKEGPPFIDLIATQVIQGGVLLLHDFDRSDEERDSYVYAIVELAIKLAHTNNIQICKTCQLQDISS